MPRSRQDRPSPEAITYLIHHLVLPPKLPQADDFDPGHEHTLISTTIYALTEFQRYLKHQRHISQVQSVTSTITNLLRSRDSAGTVSQSSLDLILAGIHIDTNQGAIPLDIKAQNAGIYINMRDDSVVFESFELSPTNRATLAAKGRLVRSFPSYASMISVDLLQNGDLRATLSQTIAKLASEVAPGFQPTVLKAEQRHDETRNTTHPGMVTNFFMNVLSALGKPVDAPIVAKNTREETFWSNSKQPWRRSPLWLLLRVSMQLQFSRAAASSEFQVNLYKPFMVFLLSRLLSLAYEHSKVLGTEILHATAAKLSRRLKKLEALSFDVHVSTDWMKLVCNNLSSTHNLIKKRWTDIMNKTELHMNAKELQDLCPENDLLVAIPELNRFIDKLSTRRPLSSNLEFQPTSEYSHFSATALPFKSESSGEYQYFWLAAVESWVELHLSQWLDKHLRGQNTVKDLRKLTQAYHGVAENIYGGLPISMSTMYLTILEMWIACDKAIRHRHPLLCDFDPEIPAELLQSLLLPRKDQMRRLFEAESYLKSRKTSANKHAPSLFRQFGHPDSFAVKFFDQSPSHQTLLSQIEEQARRKREQKCRELLVQKERYREYRKEYEQINDCDYQWVTTNSAYGTEERRHSRDCKKCNWKVQANKVAIQIFEWPLSSNQHVAKSTVFELNVPEAISHWRDMTVSMLRDVFGSKYQHRKKPRVSYTLHSDEGLSPYFTEMNETQRVLLLSEIKPNVKTHRRVKGENGAILTLKDEDVCVNNGLRYAYFDRAEQIFTDALHTTDRLSQGCTYKFPARSSQLQKYINRSFSQPDGIAPNEVIASQFECPSHISLDEYRALGTVPLGNQIQYLNILTQLAMPAIDFAKVETQILIVQTILQTGPSTGAHIERASHEILAGEDFGHAMLIQLQIAMKKVSENWESWRALASFVQLAARLLTLATSIRIQTKCLTYLDDIRKISLAWLNTLRSKAHAATGDKERAELRSRAVEIALLCISTFDIDQTHLDKSICEASTASILLQCSIVVQEHEGAVISDHGPIHLAMLQSWRCLAYRILPAMKNEIVRNGSDCLDHAITESWSAFRSASPWHPLESPKDHWLGKVTASRTHGRTNYTVHFNLLTAELLVNGLPLARLPNKYTRHESYSLLFGKCSLEVMPTTVPGMHFSAKSLHQGYELRFGMHGPDMLVQATQKGRTFDLLPRALLKGKFPTAFVENFIHWYDCNKNEVQFRPRNDPWSSVVSHWRLKKSGNAWRLTKPGISLVSMGSTSASMLSRILAPLETDLHIHALFDETSRSLEISLPRLQLNFLLEPHESRIYSRQYRGMFIDPDQGFGSLAGLINRLVLKRSDEDRLVLVPEGSVTFSRISDHVAVCIEKDTVLRVHAYQLDTILGRLLDSGNLHSKLFLCYLHALTSHCLPDPLTGQTGTETAISILRSGAVRSFDILTEENIAILELIVKLTPKRSYYPLNERVMQQIEWNDSLPSLSQEPLLYTLVQEIFQQARTVSVLYPRGSYKEPPVINLCEPHLLERDLIRRSVFRVSEFGAECYELKYDAIYESRDRDQLSTRGRQSFTAATLVLRKKPALHRSIPSDLFQTLQRKYFSQSAIKGPSRLLRPLRFDLYWLSDPASCIPDMWCSIHSSLANLPNSLNEFDFIIWLSTIAFAKQADMNVIEALAAIYNLQDVRSVSVPRAARFELSSGEVPVKSELRNLVRSASRPIANCPEATLARRARETEDQYRQRKASTFEANQVAAVDAFVRALETQWPCEQPRKPIGHDTYLKATEAHDLVLNKFKTWHDNRRFYQYLNNLCTTMSRQARIEVSQPGPIFNHSTTRPQATNSARFFSVKHIFACPAPSPASDPPRKPILHLQDLPMTLRDTETQLRFNGLCQELRNKAISKCEKGYVVQLEASFSALQEPNRTRTQGVDINDDVVALLQSYLAECRKYVQDLNCLLEDAVKKGPQKSHRCIAVYIRHSPRVSPTFWLRQLNMGNWSRLSQGWKNLMIRYGLAITELQRACRLLTLLDSPIDLAEEFRNVGHQNWNPSEFPESLLLEAESGIMIREVQEEIAKQMRSPPDDQNAVMQLNMGEGKSTVIVPIVAAALADGFKLARIIVGKPQLRQMLTTLTLKLGGLLNRRIYHMPFSRSVRLQQREADAVRRIYQDCLDNGGILLLQPEHILSFKLMGIEYLLTEQLSAGHSMLNTQRFFDTRSRDIIDESDENFSVKFELVYTMGSQRLIELSPERWDIIHNVLDLVSRFARNVKDVMPDSIEFDNRWPGRYPRVRTLRDDASNMLLHLVAEHICSVGFSGFPISRQPQAVRDAVMRYISEFQPTKDVIAEVEDGSFWTDFTRGPLLLVRGLIAGGVLRFALGSKRWRVNFGIDLNRCPKTALAVPFRSKDSPSPRTEFSHPDVVIVLTSLAYYYGGLNDDILFDTFDHLLKSDQADVEYGEWVRTASPDLGEAFRQLAGINIKDRFQSVNQVFPSLRYSKGLIDYFLARIVFPKEMKEFPHKLSASGWDIGQVKAHSTTGFSGTNDSRHVLPLTVNHLDLASQKHTNALVIAYLLQEENTIELLPHRGDSKLSDAEQLLHTINNLSTPTRVILDVGAQILEMNNRQIAETWLGMHDETSAKAVVFFDDEELSVLDRRGRIELLQVSPLAKQLDVCLIYLDESHTRGTDLKLPRDYRAAVTLGANLTKDRLVQACMRMRKLGKGQSIVFCIPWEIQSKIYEQTSRRNIEVADVLAWAISETWADLRRSVPLWATQGRRFEDHKNLLHGANTTAKQAEGFLEDEARTLENRYRPRLQTQPNVLQLDGWDTSNENLAHIIARCQEFETLNFSSASLEEEQERELSPEVEEERQVERPSPMAADTHQVDRDLIHLVQTGEIPLGSKAFSPAFQTLNSSSAAGLVDLSQFPTDLLVTIDFTRTVKQGTVPASALYLSDSFQRPVQWILSILDCRRLVVLSPFEANALVSAIRQSSKVTLHVYSPRSNLAYQPIDRLDLYTIGRPFRTTSLPRSLTVQLNLFAGQLYLRSFAEYTEMCEYVGLATGPAQAGEVVRPDGFLKPGVGKWGLKESPVPFLRLFLTQVRRDCEGIDKTHLGKVTGGTLLQPSDFQ